MKKQVRLEVCVDSLESALAAEAGGAARIELCDCLVVGGTTPSAGMLEIVRGRVKIPIHVLIRPRAGDFCYTEDELSVIEKDIAVAKSLGADGIVCGVLKPDGTVNTSVMQRLVSLARPLAFTFHRAFDMSVDPHQALEVIMSLGINYLLTSGQQVTASQGQALLAELVQRAAGRIAVMPGGGITKENVAHLVQATGVEVVHASARCYHDSRMKYRRDGLTMGAWPDDEFRYAVADQERVRQIIRAANS